MLIEPAHPEDQSAVAHLARECGLAVDARALFDSATSRVWVARADGRSLAGFLYAWEVADELQIHDLLTHSDRRRQGIGRALVGAALDYGRARGLRTALLEVRIGNRAAVALYRDAGFLPVRERPAYYADGETAVEMQLALAARPKRYLVAPLLRNERIADAYRVMTFDVPGGLDASPGQFLMARGNDWSDAPLLARPMSILSGGVEAAVLIKVVGDGTRRMARAEPGEHFTLLGPLGNRWPLPSPGHRPLLVAGGVGVAPLLFLARELARGGARPTALYGGRTDRDLPLSDELAEVTELRLFTEDGSRGSRGRVTDGLADMAGLGREVYTCGPHRMMAIVAALSEEHGLICHASLETRMACGYGVCLGCAVPVGGGEYLYACLDGPCVDARRVDWRANGEGPSPPERPT
jgi:dihydroorotate dehydrogenase electron transfer subunit